MTTVRLGAGFYCAECGIDVLEKVVVDPPVDLADVYNRVLQSKTGPNLPCGHDAPAVCEAPS